MSTDFISEFIDYMSDAGYAPASSERIMPDSKRHDYKLSVDAGRKKKGYYKLTTLPDFAFGFFGDYRDGECHGWHSKRLETLTRPEREAVHARIEQIKAQEAAIELQEHEAVALACKERLVTLDDCLQHPYLSKKGVRAYGLKTTGTHIVMPLKDEDGKIWNVQSISANGDKVFRPNGRKAGLSHTIKGDDTHCICEGYATGASIYEATGHTVHVALDAGNLLAISKQVRDNNPDAPIIICADNDFDGTDRKGNPRNVGVIKGKEAADSIGAILVYPDGVINDFNDLHKAQGLDAVKNKIRHAVSNGVGAGVALSPLGSQSPSARNLDWRGQLVYKDKGKLDTSSIHNAMMFLQHDEIFEGVFKYNEFKNDVYMLKRPPWMDEKEPFAVRRLENVDITRLEGFLESYAGLKIGSQRIGAAIESVADVNKFHPAREYFDGLEWDGTPRLATWLRNYGSATDQPKQYLATVGTMWMVAAVSRVFAPGCKFDHMLVLEGPQNAGKSMLLRTLGTFGRDIEEVYYTDAVSIGTIEERGSILKLQGNLIIEFPELAGLNKKDQDEMKRWITLQTDEVEVKFKQRTQLLSRQFVLAGTYNPTAGIGWLTDPTGGRRFWPVTVCGKVKLDKLKQDREQLWAEAVHIFRQGYDLFVHDSDPVYDLIVQEQINRADQDLWIDTLRDTLMKKRDYTTSEVLSSLGISVDKQDNRRDKNRISKVMTALGWSYIRKRPDRIYVWRFVDINNTQEVIEW